LDQNGERFPIDFGARPDFHVPHVLSGSFEQPTGIGKVRAQEEAYVDVRRKRIDVSERRVAYARGGMAVMQQLTHVLTALTHALVPRTRNRAKPGCSALEPCIDRRVSLHRTRKPEQLHSGARRVV
jgi:hypothetical protein